MLFRQKTGGVRPRCVSPLIYDAADAKSRLGAMHSGALDDGQRRCSARSAGWQFLDLNGPKNIPVANSALTGPIDASRRVSTVSVKGRRISTPRQGRGRGRVTLSPTKHEQGRCRRWRPALDVLRRPRPRVCTYSKATTANRSRVSIMVTAPGQNHLIRSLRTRDCR